MVRLIGGCAVLVCALACSERTTAPDATARTRAALALSPEGEPNGVSAKAKPLGGDNVVVEGTLYPSGDTDYFSFSAEAGDTIFAATQTESSANRADSFPARAVITLLGPDGQTVVVTSTDISHHLDALLIGRRLAAAGTYFLRVKAASGTSELRPYRLHVQVRHGDPVPEPVAEPNDGVLQSLGTGFVAGEITGADEDRYAIDLAAGETVVPLLDEDPEGDDAGLYTFVALINPDGTPILTDKGVPITVRDAGTYVLRVRGCCQQGSPGPGTYHLNVQVLPAPPPCTRYTSNPSLAIPDEGVVSATIDVPDDVLIDDVDVSIDIDHTYVNDLDAHLVSPSGNDVGLFTNVGWNQYDDLHVLLDDEAALPISDLDVLHGVAVQPEPAYRLRWLDGQRAQGTWTLKVWDHLGGDVGTLLSWGLSICPRPAPPACPNGTVSTVLYATDFEQGASGFVHSGTRDEWALGTPASPPIVGCNGGTHCFKTDLDGSYDESSTHELRSPLVSLAGVSAPIRVEWAQAYQLDSASYDHAYVDVAPLSGGAPRRLFEHLDASMVDLVGANSTHIDESAGWGLYTAEIGELVGTDVRLLFHLDADDSVGLSGMAIDDVRVLGCVGKCGNGDDDEGEACDDGNLTSGDGCDENCRPTGCGNGVVTAGEECDDGNTVSHDGCDSSCHPDVPEAGEGGAGGAGGEGGETSVSAGAGGQPHGGKSGAANGSGGGSGTGSSNGGRRGGSGGKGGNGGSGGVRAEAGAAGEGPSSGGVSGNAGRSAEGGTTGGRRGSSPVTKADSGCGCRIATERSGTAPFVVASCFLLAWSSRRRALRTRRKDSPPRSPAARSLRA